MDRYAFADAAAAESEDAVDERAAALSGGHDAVQVAVQPRAAPRVAHRHLAVAEDRSEDVVEVVRDAAGKRAHRLQALRATQLLLHLVQLFLGLLPLRDVLHEADHAGGLAGRVEQHAAFGLQPVHREVGMYHAVFRGDLAGAHCVVDRLFHRRPVVRMHDLLPRLEAAVVGPGRKAVHRLEVARPAVLAFAGADLPFERDCARRLLRELEHLLARAQLILDSLLIGDVGYDADDPLRHAVRVSKDLPARVDPARFLSAGRQNAVLECVLQRAPGKDLARHRCDVLEIAGVERHLCHHRGARGVRCACRQAQDFLEVCRREDLVGLHVPVEMPLFGSFHGERVALLR